MQNNIVIEIQFKKPSSINKYILSRKDLLWCHDEGMKSLPQICRLTQ